MIILKFSKNIWVILNEGRWSRLTKESFDSQKRIDVMNKDMKFMHKTDFGILKH